MMAFEGPVWAGHKHLMRGRKRTLGARGSPGENGPCMATNEGWGEAFLSLWQRSYIPGGEAGPLIINHGKINWLAKEDIMCSTGPEELGIFFFF